MIVIFGLEPRSVLSAFMLHRTSAAKPVRFDANRKFFFEDSIDARRANYDEIYRDYRDRFGGLDFLEDSKLNDIISAEIFWALRHRSIDRDTLVFAVLRQIETGGSRDYLSETSQEAREMRLRVRRVLAEFNRAIRYVVFRRYDEPFISIAQASFENDIADMLLRVELMRRSGARAVAVYDNRRISILANGIIFRAKCNRVPLSPERRNFEFFWNALLESGRGILSEDEIHTLREIPEIILPADVTAERTQMQETTTLDNYMA